MYINIKYVFKDWVRAKITLYPFCGVWGPYNSILPIPLSSYVLLVITPLSQTLHTQDTMLLFFLYTWHQQRFSLKAQILSLLGFTGAIISTETTQFSNHSMKTCLDYVQMNGFSCFLVKQKQEWVRFDQLDGALLPSLQTPKFTFQRTLKRNFSWLLLLSHWVMPDPMDCSTPGFPALHHLLQFAQAHVHWVDEFQFAFMHFAPELFHFFVQIQILSDTALLFLLLEYICWHWIPSVLVLSWERLSSSFILKHSLWV